MVGRYQQTSDSSFSALWKATIARKDAFCSIIFFEIYSPNRNCREYSLIGFGGPEVVIFATKIPGNSFFVGLPKNLLVPNFLRFSVQKLRSSNTRLFNDTRLLGFVVRR